jgi:prepilin peptidase CpaA
MLYFMITATVVAAIGAWTDWRTGHIPNWLTVGALIAGVAGHFARGFHFGGWALGASEAGFSLGGAFFCVLVPAFMYWKGGIGGGDVKLFAALGALCQPLGGIEAETYAFVAAALIAPARLAREGILLRTMKNSVAILFNPIRKKDQRKEIPPEMMSWFRLGPAIFVGTCATLIAHWFDLTRV